ncbi:hypothetical protein [Paraburkholderia aromaticivorans]|uniref:hypothetical protein n=1 Tax=Paraburkholderia aromaticivorans TaxID=2026199 RepID=UPI0038B76871
MSQNHETTMKDILQNEAISPYCILDFFVPFQWVWKAIFGSAKVNMVIRGGLIRDLIAVALNLTMMALVAVILIPISSTIKFLMFFVAVWWRLFTNKGAARGRTTNIWLVCWFTFLMVFVFIPLAHHYLPYVDWEYIGIRLGIV